MSKNLKPTDATERAVRLVARAIGECTSPADVIVAFKYGWARVYVRNIALVVKEWNASEEEAKQIAGELIQAMMREIDFNSIKASVESTGMYEDYVRTTAQADEILTEVKDLLGQRGVTGKTSHEDPMEALAELFKTYGEPTVH